MSERAPLDGSSRAAYHSAPPFEGVSERRTGIDVTKVQLKKFKQLLESKRDEIVKRAKQTLNDDMTLDTNDLPDEMDLASSEYLQSFTFRLRGREKSFLDKIEKALQKIEEGTFGLCEECEEEIQVKRLEARPETTLCIRCKEDQERAEKDFG
jgi:DnaK suppressor protein